MGVYEHFFTFFRDQKWWFLLWILILIKGWPNHVVSIKGKVLLVAFLENLKIRQLQNNVLARLGRTVWGQWGSFCFPQILPLPLPVKPPLLTSWRPKHSHCHQARKKTSADAQTQRKYKKDTISHGCCKIFTLSPGSSHWGKSLSRCRNTKQTNIKRHYQT